MFQTNCECILFLPTMSRLQYFKNYFLLETTSAKNCLEQYCQGFYNNHYQCHCCCYFHNHYIVPLSSLIASSIVTAITIAIGIALTLTFSIILQPVPLTVPFLFLFLLPSQFLCQCRCQFLYHLIAFTLTTCNIVNTTSIIITLYIIIYHYYYYYPWKAILSLFSKLFYFIMLDSIGTTQQVLISSR